MRVMIDGAPVDESSASISVFDWAVIRGFGVFEVVRVYGKRLFRLDPHLDRLERSAAALDIDPPDREMISRSMMRVAEECGAGQVRTVLTGGGRDRDVSAPQKNIVMWEPSPDVPQHIRAIPMTAPWHPGTDVAGFPGVKWTSYAPNMASADKAQRAGFTDALLLTTDGIVLEGPTFAYAWMCDGHLETPSLELGILASITRDVLLECAERLGIEVKQGRFPLDRVLTADEVVALSTTKEVRPVEAIGETQIAIGPVSAKLAATFHDIVREETGG